MASHNSLVGRNSLAGHNSLAGPHLTSLQPERLHFVPPQRASLASCPASSVLKNEGGLGFYVERESPSVETGLVWQPLGVASPVAAGKGLVKGERLAGAGMLGQITAVKPTKVGAD